MRYNPDTERAHFLDDLAEQSRKVIQKLNPPKPRKVVWCSLQGRWIPNPELATIS